MEHFQKIEHNLLGQSGAKLSDIKEVYSHAQGLSQCSKFIKENNIVEHIRADTAGSAEMISKKKDIKQAAIASSLSAKIYKLDIVKKNIENESGNLTRFLVMGKDISQPEFETSLDYYHQSPNDMEDIYGEVITKLNLKIAQLEEKID